MHTINCKKLLMLKPSQIKIPADRARRTADSEEMKLLSESIKLNGVIQPIAVRKSKEGFYILVSGLRRLKAAGMAGLRRVPCILYDIDAATATLYSLTENIQRAPLSYIDEAKALERLSLCYRFSKTETALKLGITQLQLSHKLQILEISDDLLSRLCKNRLEEEFARLMLVLPEYQRTRWLDTVICEQLSLNDAKVLTEQTLEPNPDSTDEKSDPIIDEIPQQKPIRKHSIGDTRLFANSLQKLTDTLKSAGMTVSLKRNETDKYTEYKVRIKKEPEKSAEFKQLKIC